MIEANLTGLSIFQTLTRSDRLEAAARRALEAEAETLAAAIRDAAPEDSGGLRESVRVEPSERPLSVVVTAGGTPETARGPGLDTALMTEYGTSEREAQPFFWPTVEAMRDNIKSNIDTIIDGAKDIN